MTMQNPTDAGGFAAIIRRNLSCRPFLQAT
jgi:hypothetical protein